LHQLDALLKALSAIDAVVALIKKAKDTETARNGLKKLLKVDDEQANWILEMQLRRLTQLDQHRLQEEVKTLRTELMHLQKFVKTPAMVTELISDELKDLKRRFAVPRLTKLVDAAAVGSGGDGMTSFTVPAEDCLLLVSRDGYAVNGQGTLRRGASMQLVGDDQMAIIAEARTDQEWLVFTDTGKAFRLRLADVPLESRKSKGVHLSKVIGIEQGEQVVGAYQIDKDRETGTLLFVYQSGMIKRTPWNDFRSAHASGVVAAKPNAGDTVKIVLDCPEEADIVLIADHGKGIRFTAASLRPMGRASAGVRGMNLPDGASVVGAAVIADNKVDQLLLVTATGFGKRIPAAELPTQGRGGSGVAVMKVVAGAKYGQPTFICRTADKSDLWVEYGQGRLKHYPVAKLAKAGRAIVPKRFPAAEKAVGIFSIREDA
jgi:DNA gyrase subunit A